MSLPISYEQMRSMVLELMAKADRGQVKALCAAVAELALTREIIKKPVGATSYRLMGPEQGLFSSQDEGRVWSIVWDLIIEGVVRPGLNDGTNNQLPHFHVTEPTANRNSKPRFSCPDVPERKPPHVSHRLPTLFDCNARVRFRKSDALANRCLRSGTPLRANEGQVCKGNGREDDQDAVR
jgi:hypothetical protein